MFAPAAPQLMAEFNSTNQALASFVVSVYILGTAAGPMLIAPLSGISFDVERGCLLTRLLQ